ncbi:concanavalin A-like lectin/glucanase domain-containing protein [Phlyctochytrium arcticum]|nr:concanavalin A-like lectin/glucanase domain-containing protein [Phlyctochytrium arcticum]
MEMLEDLMEIASGGNGVPGARPSSKPITIQPWYRSREGNLADDESQVYQTEVDIATPHLLQIDCDNFRASYIGQGSHRHDVGVIRAKIPLQPASVIGYFEVELLDTGTRSAYSIGLARSLSSGKKHAGYDSNSWGWLAGEGQKYHDHQKECYGDDHDIASGYVIGCGYHFEKGEIFFTINGESCGTAFSGVTGSLCPMIGLHSRDEAILWNFGHKPFAYDVRGRIAEERAERMAFLRNKPPDDLALGVIRSYLLHHAFGDTLECIGKSDGLNSTTSESLNRTLSTRQEIREYIMRGQVRNAINLLNEYFPRILDPTLGTYNLKLRVYCACQEFVELLRAGGSGDDLIVILQGTMGALYSPSTTEGQLSQELRERLQDAALLMAYDDPHSAPTKYLLDLSQRDELAEMLNSSIIACDLPNTADSALSVLARQLILVRSRARINQDLVPIKREKFWMRGSSQPEPEPDREPQYLSFNDILHET